MTLLDVFLGEFLGTLVLILLGNGVVANVVFKRTGGAKAGFLAITTGWGLAVFLGVMVANSFATGGHLNPAVTTMLWVKGDIEVDYAFTYYGSEFLGAIIGQIIVSTFYWQHIKEKENKEVVLAMHSTSPTHKQAWSNLFSEFVGTAILVSCAMILPLTFNGSNDPLMTTILGFAGPLSMGLVVFSIGISLGGTTGYAINPARDLGPRIVHALMPYAHKQKSNWTYSWIPVLAPLLAGVVVGGFGRLM